MARAWLKNLKIREVSSVDRGAGEGVKIMLMKRDASGSVIKEAAAEADVVAKEFADSSLDGIFNAVYALNKSVASICADGGLENKTEALTKTFEQFRKFVAGEAEAPAVSIEKEASMSDAILAKAQADLAAVTAERDTLKRSIAKMETRFAFEKMDPKERDYADDGDMDDDEKEKFGKMAGAERAAYMAANPLEKRLSAHRFAKVADNVALRKRVDDLEKADLAKTFAKRGADIGMGEAFGEVLSKAFAGDKDSVAKLESTIGALSAQVSKAGLFKEIGGAGKAVDGTARAEVAAAADAMIKADPKMGLAEATAKVLESNATLMKRYDAEMEKRA